MKKISALLLLSAIMGMSGCQPANVTAVKWDSGIGAVQTQTRCERVDMRSNGEMDELFKKYDGWKLVYISEYTTGNKIGTDAAVCFERAVK